MAEVVRFSQNFIIWPNTLGIFSVTSMKRAVQIGKPSTIQTKETKMRISEETMQDYERVKQLGYTIDVRSVRPLLIKGVWTKSFDTFEQAVAYAMENRRD